jgi:hypothetical protein
MKIAPVHIFSRVTDGYRYAMCTTKTVTESHCFMYRGLGAYSSWADVAT